MTAATYAFGRSARDRWALVGLVALGVGLPAAIGVLSGSILIPHNDDASFRRVAQTLLESGGLQLTGWSSMTLIGQLAFNAPLLWLLQGSPWAFAISTAILATIGIVAAYDLARRVLPWSRAVFAVLNLVLVPGFLLYTTAFMTDIPALSGALLCLALGAAAVRRIGQTHHRRWLIASLAVGCWAFSVREFALAAPIAVLAIAAVTDHRDRRILYVLAGLAVLAVCGAIYYYTSHLPGHLATEFVPLESQRIARVRHGLVTLGLMLAPSILLSLVTWAPRWTRSSKRSAFLLVAAGSVVVTGLLVRVEVAGILDGKGVPDLLVGNVFARDGATGNVVLTGDRPILFASPIWESFGVVALLATAGGLALLGGFLVTERSTIRRVLDVGRPTTAAGMTMSVLASFAVIFGAGTMAFGVSFAIFDRYLWPLVLPLAVLLLVEPSPAAFAGNALPRVPPRPLSWIAGALLALLGAASLLLALDSAAFDTARWRFGDEAAARGFRPETVDAGMEWVMSHATGVADVHAPPAATEMWYSALWASFSECAIVSSSPLQVPGLQLDTVDPDAYRLWLFAGPEAPLYLYRVAGPGC